MFRKPVGSPLVRPGLEGTEVTANSNERTSELPWPEWPGWPGWPSPLWLARFAAGSPAAGGDRGVDPLLARESLGPGAMPEVVNKNAISRSPTARINK
jgi:hypothetical protein